MGSEGKVVGMNVIRFYKGGRLHRDDGPAVIWSDGQKEWWVNGIMASIYLSNNDDITGRNNGGVRIWLKGGEQIHRVSAPALIEYDENDKVTGHEWYLNGECHRADGPAIIDSYNRFIAYYIHGYRHRLDGPAVVNQQDDNDDEGPLLPDDFWDEYHLFGTQFSEKSYWDEVIVYACT